MYIFFIDSRGGGLESACWLSYLKSLGIEFVKKSFGSQKQVGLLPPLYPDLNYLKLLCSNLFKTLLWPAMKGTLRNLWGPFEDLFNKFLRNLENLRIQLGSLKTFWGPPEDSFKTHLGFFEHPFRTITDLWELFCNIFKNIAMMQHQEKSDIWCCFSAKLWPAIDA